MRIKEFNPTSQINSLHRQLVHSLGIRRTPALTIGTIIISVFLVLAVVGPSIAPYGAYELHPQVSLSSPSGSFLFGTDQYGRDVFSRVLVGTRSLVTLASLSTIVAVTFGILVGMVSAYMGGLVDEIIMRLLDGIMSIPTLLTALIILAVLGSATRNVIIAIGITFVPVIARVVRSAALDVISLEYIQAARVRGESALYIMFREILPNILEPILVETAIRFSFAILSASALGFLGMGVQPPTPDWGLMVNEGRNFVMRAPWMVLFPGFAIAILIIGVNLFADGLRELFDVDPH